MATIQNLLIALGDKQDRSIILTLKHHTISKEYIVNVIYYSDLGSIVTTLITSTFSYALALEAFRKNMISLEAEKYELSVMAGTSNEQHLSKSSKQIQESFNELEIF